ncbi:MAG: hypothetical protein GY790_13405, partial [Bacteroidetes bacterium]|nr:hypothetical protein [Bacteroidota bacterium]
MSDFTPNTYIRLLEALRNRGYEFQTFEQFLTKPEEKAVVIRHDVDARPRNALRLAGIESKYGIVGTYNFRAKPQSWDEEIIKQIADLRHEIGYHYEELATFDGNHKEAIKAFRENLKKLRKLAPVKTICMHGSPTSKHDSRDLWKKRYSYRRLKIIGEPYFDVDYSNILYLTDTGRRWNGHKVSIRDKVDNKQNQILKEKGYRIRRTKDIIKASNERALPCQIMLTIHPQRWHCRKILWM